MFSFFKKKQQPKAAEENPIDLSDVFNEPIPDSLCAWMNDPDDYSDFPPIPEGAVVSARAREEFMRKRSIRADAVQQVDRDNRAAKASFGLTYSAEQREQQIQEYARQLQDIDDGIDIERSLERASENRADRRHEELLDAIEDSSAFAAGKKLAKEHPFVTGWIAADIVHKLKK
jgi:hypothetical protein